MRVKRVGECGQHLSPEGESLSFLQSANPNLRFSSPSNWQQRRSTPTWPLEDKEREIVRLPPELAKTSAESTDCFSNSQKQRESH